MLTIPKLLLICGIVGSLAYLLSDIVAATFLYPGYDITTQQVSELSAIGAPSRPYWVAMGYPYALLILAFAAGVWMAANGNWALRVASVFLVLFAVNGFFWGLVAPMHMRATEFTDSDTMHIAFAISAIVIMLTFIISGAVALGTGFRIYSAITVVAMMGAGGLVSTQVAAIAAGQPTPWMGLVERVSVYSPMIWIVVFAVMLLEREGA